MSDSKWTVDEYGCATKGGHGDFVEVELDRDRDLSVRIETGSGYNSASCSCYVPLDVLRAVLASKGLTIVEQEKGTK